MDQKSRRDFVAGAGAALLGVAAVASASQPSVESVGDQGRKIIPGSPYATFSRAVRLDKLVFVAGVVGQKPGTREMVPGPFEEEAKQTLENLKASIEASGSRMSNVLKCTVFIKDADDFAVFNKVYVTFFPKDPPARSSVVVKDLVVPAARLEIDCVTCLD